MTRFYILYSYTYTLYIAQFHIRHGYELTLYIVQFHILFSYEFTLYIAFNYSNKILYLKISLYLGSARIISTFFENNIIFNILVSRFNFKKLSYFKI